MTKQTTIDSSRNGRACARRRRRRRRRRRQHALRLREL
jgi:hypothetical protein